MSCFSICHTRSFTNAVAAAALCEASLHRTVSICYSSGLKLHATIGLLHSKYSDDLEDPVRVLILVMCYFERSVQEMIYVSSIKR